MVGLAWPASHGAFWAGISSTYWGVVALSAAAVATVTVLVVKARRKAASDAALLKTLGDPRAPQAAKLQALDRMAESADPVFIEAMGRAATGGDPRLAKPAEVALRTITPLVREKLFFSLRFGFMPSWRERAAGRLSWLGRVVPDESIVSVMRAAIWRDPDPDVQLALINGLVRVGTPSAMEALVWFSGRLGRPALEKAAAAGAARLRAELGERAVPVDAGASPGKALGGRRLMPLLTVMGIGSVFAAIELIGGHWTNSLALTTDATHLFADVLVNAAAAMSLWLGSRPPSPRRTFGYGKAESIFGLAASGFLFYTAGEMAVSAFHRLFAPPAVTGGATMLIALAGLASNLLASLVLRSHQKQGASFRAAFLHAATDAVGSGVIIASGFLVQHFGWAIADPLASLLVAAFVVKTTLDLFSPSLNDLFNGVPAGMDVKAVQADLESVPGVKTVHRLRLWSQGSQQAVLAAHLVVAEGTDEQPVLKEAARRLSEKYGITDASLQVELANAAEPEADTASRALAAPISKADFDVLVVGTGYGGAPQALRWAEAGYKVGVLEEGPRRRMGEFPKGEQSQWDPAKKRFGTHSIRPLGRRVLAWHGKGVGGGSLVNASVMIRKDDFTGFPGGIDRKELDPYYDTVEEMLDAKPYPFDVPGSPYQGTRKTLAVLKAAERLGAKPIVPKLAVTYRDAAEPVGTIKPNKFGADQQGCRQCGECCIPGCNYGAKNTLDLNYLHKAEKQFGARIVPMQRAGKVEPLADGSYRVFAADPATGIETSYTTKVLILAGGALGSTETLLLNKHVHKTLPNLSSRLGKNYTSNGNFIGFAVDAKNTLGPDGGPEITAGMEFPGTDGKSQGVLIFDGGFRQPWIVIGKLIGLPMFVVKIADWVLKRAQKAGVLSTKKSLPLLVVGRDQAVGELKLDRNGRLEAELDPKTNASYYKRVTSLLQGSVKTMEAAFLPFLVWTLFGKIEVPHSLGGAPMGDSKETGVVDDKGRVYGYDNMIVMDGSVIPVSLGVNPANTIAALSERSAKSNIEQFKKEGKIRTP